LRDGGVPGAHRVNSRAAFESGMRRARRVSMRPVPAPAERRAGGLPAVRPPRRPRLL